MMKRLALAAVIALSAGSAAYAQVTPSTDNTGKMTISATYVPGCTISFVDGGTYDLGKFSSIKTQPFPSGGLTRQFTYNCSTGNSPTSVKLQLAGDRGTPATGAVAGQRYLASDGSDKNATPFIPINIYIGGNDSGTIWGDGTNGTQPITMPPNAAPNGNYQFTMQIPAYPDFVEGSSQVEYSNTFVAQIVYSGATGGGGNSSGGATGGGGNGGGGAPA